MSVAKLKEQINVRAIQANLPIECSSDGLFNASIAVVAEAPGEVEVQKKLPLVGPSGSLLWKTLRRHGISRMDCYITNVAKRQISFTSGIKQPLNKLERQQWNELLLWELSQLPSLKYVVAAGNFALSALTGREGITQWRGSVLDVELPGGRSVKVICTFNPALVLREPKNEIIFSLDMHKVRRVIDGKHKVPTIQTHINPSYSEAMDFLDATQRESVLHETPVSLDIEVVSLETACIGLAQSSTEAMCINWRTVDEQRYDVPSERRLRQRVQQLLFTPGIKLIAQNGSFDASWLWHKDKIRVPSFWFDTMLAHHTLYPTLPHNLGFITAQYTDHPYYKDERKEWREGGDINSFWEYNGKDCCITWQAQTRIEHELRKAGLEKFFYDHVMRLQPHLIRMTVGGVKIDMSLKEKIREQVSEDVAKKLNEFHEAVRVATGDDDYTPNPRSPAQLAQLFFNKLQLVGRGTSTDEANRTRMLEHPRTTESAKRVIYTLNAYATEHKFFSTYVDMQVDEDDRARSEYKQTGVQTAPGRLSSSKVMWGSGMNLQNQPPRSHPMFVADEGYSIGYFDMSQAEARIVAYLANIPIWKEQFERARIDGSYDAHRALASDMFGVPYDEVPTDDRVIRDDGTHAVTLRFIAKRCRHGLNYRMMPERLAETTGLPLKDAIRAFNAYHRTTPELKRWWQTLEKEVYDHKVLYNSYGRRLIILERITQEAMESIVAFKPQSTLGDHVTRVMYLAEDDDKWPHDARMWLNVHDALLFVAPHHKVVKCLRIAKRYAETPILINGELLTIPCECKVSYPDEHGIHRWSQLKKVHL